MLDSDPTDQSTPTAGESGDNPSTGSPAAPSPRKRAPRKTAAKKAVPAQGDAPADNTAAPKAPAAGGGDSDATAPAPRKRAPRKAAAAARPSPTPALTTDDAAPALTSDDAAPAKKAPARRSAAKAPAFSAGAADAAPTLDAPTPDAPTPDVPESDAAAAPTRPARKRAAKKSAATPGSAAIAADDGASVEPAMTAPGVLFMAPVADAQDKPKRRPAKKQAASANDGADTPGSDEPTPAATSTARKRAAKKVTTPTPDATDGADAGNADAETDEDSVADPDDVREAAIEQASGARRRRRRGRRGRGGGGGNRNENDDDTADDETVDADASSSDDADTTTDPEGEDGDEQSSTASRRRRRRRRSGNGEDGDSDDPPNTVTHVREPKAAKDDGDDGVRGVKGSTRLEAKRQRRRDGRETTRRRTPILSESEFLARREAVDRVMAVRQHGDRTQIAVLEDGILVEHYVTRASATSYVGNVYLGRVQNVLPSMEAAFIDISKGRNGVLYAGEVNWEAAGLGGKSRAIENAMKSGDPVLVQVSKDPVGHKGARLTSQISLPGRFLVLVPGGGMTGISRRLPDTERHRLKAILKKIVPEDAGVIVRTAAEGASEEDLTRDVERLAAQWESIQEKAKNLKSAPSLVHGEPDLATRVVRDVFNEDFKKLVVDGADVWETISEYIGGVAPDLADRVSRHTADTDLFHDLRVDEQLMKALDRKVWLPSGGSLVIDRTEAMTVVDVNTGKFIGSGGNLEQTVTRNNIEAAEEIVRQLRLRDIGGIVVIDFIDMVLESNRELVLRRLTECLGRDRTKHQVAEVTSLGLVQMTRKRVGEGLLEAFSENCEHCNGRGLIIHSEPVDKSSDNSGSDDDDRPAGGNRNRRKRGGRSGDAAQTETVDLPPAASPEQRQAAVAAIAAVHRAAEGDKIDADAPLVDELASGLFAAALEAKSEADDSAPPAAPSRGTGRSRRRASAPAQSAPVQSAPAQADSAQADSVGADSAQAESVQAQPARSAPAPEPVTAESEQSRPPARRARRVATRPAGGPPAAEPAVVVLDEPAAANGSRPVSADVTPVADALTQAPEPAATPARPRRRRAASRPAGPPTT